MTGYYVSCPTCGGHIDETAWPSFCSNPIHKHMGPLSPEDRQKWHDALERENVRRSTNDANSKS